jgi:hypothetical protein
VFNYKNVKKKFFNFQIKINLQIFSKIKVPIKWHISDMQDEMGSIKSDPPAYREEGGGGGLNSKLHITIPSYPLLLAFMNISSRMEGDCGVIGGNRATNQDGFK